MSPEELPFLAHIVVRVVEEEVVVGRPYAFTFWHGVSGTPAYIEMCLETHHRVLRDDFEVVCLDADSVAEWVPEHELLWSAATPVEQANSFSLPARHVAMFTGMVRVGLLARCGGLWVDADMLALPPLRLLAPLIDEYDLVCGELQSGGISNGVLGARPGSRFIATYWETILERARAKTARGEGARWGEFGVYMLTDVFLRHGDENTWVAPWGAFDNLNWRLPRPTFEPGTGIETLPPFAMDVCIFNNATAADVRERTKADLLAEKTIFSEGYRVAMGQKVSPHLALRTTEQLRSLNRANLVWHSLREVRNAKRANSKLRRSVERLEVDLAQRTEQRDVARRRLRRARRRAAALEAELAGARRRRAGLRRRVGAVRRKIRTTLAKATRRVVPSGQGE